MINISKTGVGIGGNAPSAGLSISYTNVGVGTTAPSDTKVLIGTSSVPVNINTKKIGLGTSVTASSSDGIYVGTTIVPDGNAVFSCGTSSLQWSDVQTAKLNGVAIANYTNNLSFARVDLANVTKSSGIGTWTGATGAKANCFVMVSRGNSTTAGSVWYIADAWCSADNTIKFIFQASGGGSTTPSSGAVNIIWANGN